MKYALENGIINLSYVQDKYEMSKREELLSKHKWAISQGKDGYWRTYLPDENKGRKMIKKKSREQIENEVIKYLKEQNENPTINDIFTEWNDRRLKLGKIRHSTHTRNQQVFNRHYKDKFGQNQIKQVNPNDIIEFLEEQIPKHHLKSRAFSNLKGITTGIFKYAKRNGLISFNIEEVFYDLDVSEKEFYINEEKEYDQIFNEEEMPLIIKALSEDKKNILSLGLLLMFATGVRVGELAAFKWDDWDGCSIKVLRTETRYKPENSKWEYEIVEFPKTPAGIRSAVVPPHCLWIIKEIRKLNPFGEFMFERIDGSRIKTYSFRRKLSRICKKISISPKSPHKIRKTYASILLDNHISEKNIIELMGHTDISTTKKFYSKNRRSDQKKAEILETIPEFQII